MDGLVFNETLVHLTKALRKALEEEDKTDTLSLQSIIKADTLPDPNEERPEDEEEFLKLHDGNYLKAKEAGEA